MNSIKEIIKEKLSNQDLEDIEKLILDYQQEAPEDLELISIKVMYFLLICNYEEALAWASIGIRKNPHNAEMNYNYAYINELVENYYEAYVYYRKTLFLASYQNNTEILELNLNEKIKEVLDAFVEKVSLGKDKHAMDIIIKQLESIRDDCTCFGLGDDIFKDNNAVGIGIPYRDYSGNEVYIGYYDRIINYISEPANLVHSKGEMRKIILEGKEFQVREECDQIIPILSQSENELEFIEESNVYNLPMNNPNHFIHYKVKPNTRILSKNPIHIAKPIPIKQNPLKKRLVLSLFVDGLSQVVLDEEGFEKIMPNTYNFFCKGVICKNAYSASDWTYPSLATYMTGLDIRHHMMIHNEINTSLPLDVTLLTEYFSEEGYQTAKIDGDWRTTPNYGYLRGIDRVIYQHQWTGMKTWDVIGDAIEHMELMKDTNQYLWLGIGDLHDISDEIDLQPSVESKLSLQERVVEQGTTSVKQPYSMNKRIAYIHQAKMVDQHLSAIYNFIEQNYKDDEIMVSLFSDHGQGYLVKSDKFFLARERTNIAFMFRGGNIKPNINEELISTTDYSTIMCQLCNIHMKDEEIDGRLPQLFGGKNAREYVITESIHPNDPYYASVYWKDYVCNFTSIATAQEDGRFNLHEGYRIQMIDYEGQELMDESKKDKNLDIILSHIAGLLIYN